MDECKKAKRRKVPEEVAPVRVRSWDEEEKKVLLDALKKYGHTDIDNIVTQLPHKTKAAVRSMINKLQSIAEKTGVMSSNQINAWLESGHFDEEDDLIPLALKYISLFEDHPPPEEVGGCDFKLLYDMLYRATLGQPLDDPPGITQEVMCFMLDQVIEEVWPQYEEEVALYIENLERDKTRKVYRPQRQPSEDDSD